jgi:hypothetical protein
MNLTPLPIYIPKQTQTLSSERDLHLPGGVEFFLSSVLGGGLVGILAGGSRAATRDIRVQLCSLGPEILKVRIELRCHLCSVAIWC